MNNAEANRRRRLYFHQRKRALAERDETDRNDSKGGEPGEEEETVEAPKADTKKGPETWAETGLGYFYPDN